MLNTLDEPDYAIQLPHFTGPLDLLLHLIRKQEMDIHDIPIAEVTHQYMAYLSTMQETYLEVASDFVVMAATLLSIKSRMLLPQKATDVDTTEEDPRTDLVKQLLEYEQIKVSAEVLRERAMERALLFTRQPMDLSPYASVGPTPLVAVSVWNLVDAFRAIYRRLPKETNAAEIRTAVLRMEDVSRNLLERLRRYGRCFFFDLLQSANTRSELVATFLVLLELMKDQIVQCIQPHPLSDIEVIYTEKDVVSESMPAEHHDKG